MPTNAEIETLIMDNRRLVQIIINTQFPQLRNDEDAEQEGMVGLCNAGKGFNPKRECTFQTYASRCISTALLDYLRHQPPETVPLEVAERNTAFADAPEDGLINRVDLAKHLADLESHNPLDAYIIRQILDGRSYASIGAEIGVSRQRIEQRKKQAVKFMQKEIG